MLCPVSFFLIINFKQNNAILNKLYQVKATDINLPWKDIEVYKFDSMLFKKGGVGGKDTHLHFSIEVTMRLRFITTFRIRIFHHVF